jgi:hypothetical protein
MKKKTVTIIAAHRLGTVRGVNNIVGNAVPMRP